MVTVSEAGSAEAVMALLEQVRDPEIPEIGIVDLGIVRKVETAAGGGWRVTITPTYSGCPAYEVIQDEIVKTLEAGGCGPVEIVRELVPPWTTDWMSDKAKETLKRIGIAPPGPVADDGEKPVLMFTNEMVPCPRCGSENTELVSRFGATACKSLHRCNDCSEPFESFKPI